MLKLSRENKSAAAPIHAREMTVRVHEQTFPLKKSSRFEDQKVQAIAALFIYYFH